MDWNKFLSRKFIAFVAAFLASISGSVTGIAVGNETLQWVGVVCAIVSAGLYKGLEAAVDIESIKASASTTTTTITATASASQKQANELVQNVTDTTKKG